MKDVPTEMFQSRIYNDQWGQFDAKPQIVQLKQDPQEGVQHLKKNLRTGRQINAVILRTKTFARAHEIEGKYSYERIKTARKGINLNLNL